MNDEPMARRGKDLEKFSNRKGGKKRRFVVVRLYCFAYRGKKNRNGILKRVFFNIGFEYEKKNRAGKMNNIGFKMCLASCTHPSPTSADVVVARND